MMLRIRNQQQIHTVLFFFFFFFDSMEECDGDTGSQELTATLIMTSEQSMKMKCKQEKKLFSTNEFK